MALASVLIAVLTGVNAPGSMRESSRQWMAAQGFQRSTWPSEARLTLKSLLTPGTGGAARYRNSREHSGHPEDGAPRTKECEALFHAQ